MAVYTADGFTIDVKTDWKSTDSIEFEDFDRIEANISSTRDYILSIQYEIPAITSNTTRSQEFIDYLSSINRIEQNLETIRTNFYTPVGYGGSATWVIKKPFDYNEANRLEGNILKMFRSATTLKQSFVICGTTYAGQARGELGAL